MAVTVTAPRAPTIADLLEQQGGSPVTTRQDEARERLLQSIAGGRRPDPSDKWGNVQHALQTGINYWAGHQGVKEAQARDQAEMDQRQASQRNIAELLVGQGYTPQEAVGLASGGKDNQALIMGLMGMQQDSKRYDAERAYQQQRDTAEDQRWSKSYEADRADAAANRALKERQIALSGRPKEPAVVQTLRAMGIDPRGPEGQQIIRDSLTGAAEGQNANRVGKIPAGMVAIPDQAVESGYRMVPMEGSPEQVDRASAQEKQLLRQEKDRQDLGTMMRDINRVLEMSRGGGGGPIEGQMGQMPVFGPMTASGQMSKHLESIKANIAFDELQAMRDSSPTGGAVGQLTDKERDALAAASGSLDPTLPEADLQRNLVDLGVKRITAVHGTDAQIAAAAKSGKITPEQAAQGRAIRDRQIAEFRSGGNVQPSAPAQPAQQAAFMQETEARGEALAQEYMKLGMSEEEAFQRAVNDLRQSMGR